VRTFHSTAPEWTAPNHIRSILGADAADDSLFFSNFWLFDLPTRKRPRFDLAAAQVKAVDYFRVHGKPPPLQLSSHLYR
jgi:hypothetical protein